MSGERLATPVPVTPDYLPLTIVGVPMIGAVTGLIHRVRSGTGTDWALEVATMALFSLFLVVVSGVGLWFWLGCIRWPRRLAATVVAIALLQLAAWEVAGDDVPQIFGLLVMLPSTTCFGVLVVAVHRTRFRMKLVSSRFGGDPMTASASRRVFSIADLLFWAFAAAALFAVVRSTPAEIERLGLLRRIDGEVVGLGLMSMSCFVVSLIALWAVFGSGWLFMRLVALADPGDDDVATNLSRPCNVRGSRRGVFRRVSVSLLSP